MSYYLDNVEVQLIMGQFDDSDLDLVVKSQDIPLGLSPSGILGSGGTVGGFGITVKEASNAGTVLQWPELSIENPDRRELIYETTRNALITADEIEAVKIGLFTMGLEVSRIPSWEVAEEIVRAVYEYSREPTKIEKVFLVVSSTTQESSFQFTLSNPTLLQQR